MKKINLLVFVLFLGLFSLQAHSAEILIGGNVKIGAKTKHEKCKKYVERIGAAALKAKKAYENDKDEDYQNYYKYIVEQKKKLKKCNKKQNDIWHKLGRIAPAGFLICLTILF